MFVDKAEEFHQNIVAVLREAMSVGKHMGLNRHVYTLAVVLLHVLNAASAASMAPFVSATPISGTVPNSSPVAGSNAV